MIRPLGRDRLGDQPHRLPDRSRGRLGAGRERRPGAVVHRWPDALVADPHLGRAGPRPVQQGRAGRRHRGVRRRREPGAAPRRHRLLPRSGHQRRRPELRLRPQRRAEDLHRRTRPAPQRLDQGHGADRRQAHQAELGRDRQPPDGHRQLLRPPAGFVRGPPPVRGSTPSPRRRPQHPPHRTSPRRSPARHG